MSADEENVRLRLALKNILMSSRWSGTPPTAYAKIAAAALEGVDVPVDTVARQQIAAAVLEYVSAAGLEAVLGLEVMGSLKAGLEHVVMTRGKREGL